MDEKDHQLISLLRDNARRPISVLANALGVSRGTLQNRLDRLLAEGTILGFTLRLRPDVQRAAIRAITLVEVEGERTERIIKDLRGYPEVHAVHTTNGRWDLVLELETDTLEAFDLALRRIREVKGIANSETSLLLTSF